MGFTTEHHRPQGTCPSAHEIENTEVIRDDIFNHFPVLFERVFLSLSLGTQEAQQGKEGAARHTSRDADDVYMDDVRKEKVRLDMHGSHNSTTILGSRASNNIVHTDSSIRVERADTVIINHYSGGCETSASPVPYFPADRVVINNDRVVLNNTRSTTLAALQNANISDSPGGCETTSLSASSVLTSNEVTADRKVIINTHSSTRETGASSVLTSKELTADRKVINNTQKEFTADRNVVNNTHSNTRETSAAPMLPCPTDSVAIDNNHGNTRETTPSTVPTSRMQHTPQVEAMDDCTQHIDIHIQLRAAGGCGENEVHSSMSATSSTVLRVSTQVSDQVEVDDTHTDHSTVICVEGATERDAVREVLRTSHSSMTATASTVLGVNMQALDQVEVDDIHTDHSIYIDGSTDVARQMLPTSHSALSGDEEDHVHAVHDIHPALSEDEDDDVHADHDDDIYVDVDDVTEPLLGTNTHALGADSRQAESTRLGYMRIFSSTSTVVTGTSRYSAAVVMSASRWQVAIVAFAAVLCCCCVCAVEGPWMAVGVTRSLGFGQTGVWCMCVYTYVCMYVNVRMYVCVYVCVYLCMKDRDLASCCGWSMDGGSRDKILGFWSDRCVVHVCMYVCMYVNVRTYVCVYVCMYVRSLGFGQTGV
jgi:hypothetical protein